MATMEKTFPCLTCGQEIKLERDQVKQKWNRYNLDGTPHTEPKKQFQSSKTFEKIEQLERKIDTLTAEVQALRQELKVKT
jgi:hypothetical protein